MTNGLSHITDLSSASIGKFTEIQGLHAKGRMSIGENLGETMLIRGERANRD